MAKLIYSAITSLDGYVADENGNFDWAAPDEEVHAFVNDLERPIGTYLYGRRMYEVMTFWETAHTLAGEPPAIHDYAAIDCVPCWKDLSPRLSAAYDLFGTGKTAVKVSVARFVGQQSATGIPSLNNPVQTTVKSATRSWNDGGNSCFSE